MHGPQERCYLIGITSTRAHYREYRLMLMKGITLRCKTKIAPSSDSRLVYGSVGKHLSEDAGMEKAKATPPRGYGR